MKRLVLGTTIAAAVALSSISAHASCIFADKQYSDGASLCISQTTLIVCSPDKDRINQWGGFQLQQQNQCAGAAPAIVSSVTVVTATPVK